MEEDIDVAPFSWLDPHDVLAESTSDSNGYFNLSGSTEEFTAIEPVIEIVHDCNDGIKKGHRKIRLGLPDQYITSARTPSKVVYLGVLNLELEYKNEEREDDEDDDEAETLSRRS
ncbi:unnamed protein product [Nippostrongylus brasiliensis]|uniref:Transthyretin-like family protein n=1 Tax=Nippostrongylus brasiliensis TaxID=27835 RepID=A0A0N4YCW9_NIPBR|nr:unnamed protein product [Nippostrongylus brasiliensis]